MLMAFARAGREQRPWCSSGNLRDGELDITDAGSGLDGRSNSDSCNCSNGSESLLHGGRRKRLRRGGVSGGDDGPVSREGGAII